MKRTFIGFAVLGLLACMACSSKEVSFATLEDARRTARENALFNAQEYRKMNPLYLGSRIIERGDSTQAPDCPQGDGWATMEFLLENPPRIIKVKCSTVSLGLGCLEDSDFKTKAYASEDGHCQPVNKVPFPLPKIAK